MATSSKTSSSKSTAGKTTKSTAGKSATAKSSTSKTSGKSTYKPGETAGSNLRLFVKDSKGKTLGEINVPQGNKVPPSAKKKASTYEMKK